MVGEAAHSSKSFVDLQMLTLVCILNAAGQLQCFVSHRLKRLRENISDINDNAKLCIACRRVFIIKVLLTCNRLLTKN